MMGELMTYIGRHPSCGHIRAAVSKNHPSSRSGTPSECSRTAPSWCWTGADSWDDST